MAATAGRIVDATGGHWVASPSPSGVTVTDAACMGAIVTVTGETGAIVTVTLTAGVPR